MLNGAIHRWSFTSMSLFRNGEIMIISVLGEKGGTGKTTLATNLAAIRATGSDLILLDADRQGSSSFWVQEREAAEDVPRIACVQKFGRGLASQIRDLARRYDDVIIDVGAGDSIEIDGALNMADKVLIPIAPSAMELWTLGLMDNKIGDALIRNEGLEAWLIFNRVSTNQRSQDYQSAFEAAAACEFIRLSSCRVRERVSVKRAAAAGLGVVEYRPLDSKANDEFMSLYNLAFNVNNEEDIP